jgi:hypothetical protein
LYRKLHFKLSENRWYSFDLLFCVMIAAEREFTMSKTGSKVFHDLADQGKRTEYVGLCNLLRATPFFAWGIQEMKR